MAGTTTGTPKSRALGVKLREARKASGYSLRGLADELVMSHSVLSRWENGERVPHTEDVASVLTAIGINGDERAELLDLARDADAPQWLSVRSADRERQIEALLDFESNATRITDVSPLLIPGLLQTAGYARAIMVAGGVPAGQIESRVVMRVGRREVLERRNPARLVALIGEGTLRHEVGGREVMLEQLRHLYDLAQRPNIDVGVVGESTGWSPALEGPFVLVDCVDAAPIVHLENRRAGLFFHEPDDVTAYRKAVDMVTEVAMSPVESMGVIADAITGMETTQ